MALPQLPALTGLERVFTFELPMREQVNKRGDKESLNLNVFRNQHHYKLNHQKKAFQKRMKKGLTALPKLGKIWLHYEVHPKTRVRLDTMNPGSVIDKFFSDALVEHGVIEDDNYHYVVFNSFCFGSVEKTNPHVLVTIIEIEPIEEDPDMRILLDQDDIQAALETFVETQGISGASGVTLSVTDGNIEAEVMMGTAPAAPAKPKRRSPVKKTTTTKPKTEEVAKDVEPPVPDSSDSDGAGPAESGKEETVPAKDSAPETEKTAKDSNSDGGANKGKTSKNLFADTPGESSKDTDGDKPAETKGDDPKTEAPVKKRKTSSIFDQ